MSSAKLKLHIIPLPIEILGSMPSNTLCIISSRSWLKSHDHNKHRCLTPTVVENNMSSAVSISTALCESSCSECSNEAMPLLCGVSDNLPYCFMGEPIEYLFEMCKVLVDSNVDELNNSTEPRPLPSDIAESCQYTIVYTYALRRSVVYSFCRKIQFVSITVHSSSVCKKLRIIPVPKKSNELPIDEYRSVILTSVVMRLKE